MPDDATVVVQLRAEIGNLTSQLNAANAQIDSFGKKAQGSFADLGRTMAGVFSVAAIGAYVKASINSFAQYERALENLGAKVTAAGGNWKKLRGEVKSYAEQIEETTRFSDDDALKALDALMLKTNDLAASQALLERAMNLSVASGLPLVETANMLALAYQGNTRGLMMLTKTLGLTKTEGMSATEMFALLDARMGGLARTEATTATEMEKVANAFDDVQQILGEGLAPAVHDLAPTLKTIAGWLVDGVRKVQEWGATWAYMALNTVSLLKGVVKYLVTFAMTAADLLTHPTKAYANYLKRATKIEKDRADESLAITRAWSETMGEIYKDETASGERIAREAAARKIVALNRDSEIVAALIRSETDYYEEAARKQVSIASLLGRKMTSIHKAYRREQGENDDEYKARVKRDQGEIEERIKATYAAIQQVASGITEALASASGEMVKVFQDSTATIGDAFKALGQSILRSLIKAFGRALVQEGAAYMARAIAALLGIVTAAAAPGLFAAAAAMAAAGGAMVALGDTIKLAEGGIVTAPTMAMIGEAGPEAVIPLNRAGGLGGETHFGTVNMEFPGVRNADDVRSPRFAQTAQRQLAAAWQTLAQRRGIKRTAS